MTPAFLDQLRQYVSAEAYRQLPPDELWAKVRDALDETAFRVLLEQIGGRVFHRCRAILRDEFLAEEAFQDTFRDLIRKRAAIPSFHSAAAWAYRAATNHSNRLRRKRQRWPSGEPVEPAVAAASHDTEEALARGLASLPDRYRRPLELVFWNGLTHAEAARALGWSKGTVDSYVARGLQRLRVSLKALGLPAASVALEATLAKPAAAVNEALLAGLMRAVWPAGGPAVAAAPWWGTVWKKAAVALAAVGTVAVAGGVWWRASAPPDGPPGRPQGPTVESVPDRNLRVFRGEVASRVSAALRELALGGGDVSLETAEAYDARLDCTFALHHRTEGGPGWVSRIRLIYDSDLRTTSIFFDLHGNARYRAIARDRPIVLWRNPITGVDAIVPSPALRAVEVAFETLPRDDRAAAETARARAAVAAAVGRYEGLMYRGGDPNRGCRVETTGREPVLIREGHNVFAGWWHVGRPPDDRLYGISRWDGPVVFSADGRRLDFPLTGEWWTRDPSPAIAK